MSVPISSKTRLELARELNITPETIRNWLKTGVVQDETLEALRTVAETRLTRRVNRTQAVRSASTVSQRRELENLLDIFRFYQEKEAQNPVFTEFFLFSCISKYATEKVSRLNRDMPKSLQEELSAWEKSFRMCSVSPLKTELKVDSFPENLTDFPEILYQTLTQAGTRAKMGAFFTPIEIAEEAVRGFQTVKCGMETILDPCCGSGSFLRAARRELGLPLTSIFGLDLDPISVHLARVNLILDTVETITKTEEEPGSPQIFCGDGLGALPTGFPKKFQKIATNPPWGARNVPKNTKNETFTQFLRRAHELLTENGEAVFLLPEAFLNIKIHAPTRRFLLENTHIHEISSLGRIFPEVFTPVIRLHSEKKTKKTPISPRFITKIRTASSEINDFPQEGFSQFPQDIFSLRATPETVRILKKMTTIPHMTLKNHAQWGLGIVTGNNSRWLRKVPDFREDKKDSDVWWEPIIRGTDIEPFRIGTPKYQIRFQPEYFQQSLPEERYRAPEKIVYRFITSHPTFALDTEGRLTLNSANFLIPSLPGYSSLLVTLFLNSEAFQFLFREWFFTHKVLKSNLERLPFLKISEKVVENLEKEVKGIFSGMPICDKIEMLVYSTFHLTRAEIEYIRRALK